MASNLSAIFKRVSSKPVIPKTAAWKAAALATGLGIAMLAYPAQPSRRVAAIRCRVSMTRSSAR